MHTKNGTGASEHQLQKKPVHMQISRGQTFAKLSKLNAMQALRHSQMQMQHMQSVSRGDCKASPQVSKTHKSCLQKVPFNLLVSFCLRQKLN